MVAGIFRVSQEGGDRIPGSEFGGEYREGKGGEDPVIFLQGRRGGKEGRGRRLDRKKRKGKGKGRKPASFGMNWCPRGKRE